MKILIAGVGKVGTILTKKLAAEGHDLTLIDRSAEVVESCVEFHDVAAVRGNCASMEVLRQAGVEEAELLIAATGADEVNLLCCMTAHKLNKRLHTIARIRNPEYSGQVYSMKEAFALSLTVNPERQAAVEIERLLKYPAFLKRDTFAKGRVEIVELEVDENSKLRDVPLSALNNIIKCRVLVCAVLRDGRAITPGGDFVLKAGDRIFVTATTNNLTTLLKSLGLITQRARRVMLAGGGRVSFYLAQLLEKSGVTVQIIEQDLARCEELAARLPDTGIVHGDASSQALLESEGIAGYDAFVSLTGVDELNMVMSMYGDCCGVPRVITKLGRLESSEMLDRLPIGSVVCPKELCSNAIVRYVRAMQNQTGAALSMHTIADGEVEAIEFAVDEHTKNCGVPLKDLRLRKGVLVVGISHGANTEIAGGDSVFRRGDIVVLVCRAGQRIHQLNDIFDGGGR